MAAAQNHDGASMLPYFSICTFAGVRPAETRRLTWDDIDFEKGHIYVAPGSAKTRIDRYVDIEPALAVWLSECPTKEGLICPFDGREFDKRFGAVREAAGVKDAWASDVMRHSYCSMWIALGGDQNRLLEMAGHSISVSLRHYRKGGDEGGRDRVLDNGARGVREARADRGGLAVAAQGGGTRNGLLGVASAIYLR